MKSLESREKNLTVLVWQSQNLNCGVWSVLELCRSDQPWTQISTWLCLPCVGTKSVSTMPSWACILDLCDTSVTFPTEWSLEGCMKDKVRSKGCRPLSGSPWCTVTLRGEDSSGHWSSASAWTVTAPPAMQSGHREVLWTSLPCRVFPRQTLTCFWGWVFPSCLIILGLENVTSFLVFSGGITIYGKQTDNMLKGH